MAPALNRPSAASPAACGDASGAGPSVARRLPGGVGGVQGAVPAGAATAAPAGVPQRLPLHPGRFLERHYLRPLALSQTEAARRLGISRRRLNELVQGHRCMTPDTAIRCALAFGLPVGEWLALQARWDSFQTWKQLRHLVQPVPRTARRGGASRRTPPGGRLVMPPVALLAATPPSVRAAA